MLNAISYLFHREEIPPEIVRNIMLYCLDCFGPDGASGKCGTSCMAMMFLSNWLSGFGQAGHLPVSSQYLSGREVNFSQNGGLSDALRRKGAAVVRVDLEGWHYVLLTGIQKDMVYFFDPYYRTEPFDDSIFGLKLLARTPIIASRQSTVLRETAYTPCRPRKNGKLSCCSMRTQS